MVRLFYNSIVIIAIVLAHATALTGKPVAMDSFTPVTLFDEEIRLDSRSSQPEDKLAELADVIGAICLKPTRGLIQEYIRLFIVFIV
jgi:hypothetical protein